MMKGFKSTTLVLAALSALFCLNPMDARAEQTAVVQEANQSKKISGQVLDEYGDPMIGVTIRVKGSQLATVTDLDGNFSLSVPGNKAELEISYIGYQTANPTAVAGTPVKVTMQPEQNDLDEVVVIGFGVVKKRDVTGSVASIKSEAIVQAPTSDLSTALQGRISGLDVNGDQLRIRGNRSINGNNAPLVIIDGVMGGSMSDLNPDDIESVDVLKDASSTAIYGSQGANGVIIITTKKADVGKMHVSYSGFVTGAFRPDRPDYREGENWYETRRQAAENAGLWNSPADDLSIFGSNEAYAAYRAGAWTDYEDLLQKDMTVSTKHTVTLSGGTEKTSARFSLGYANRGSKWKDSKGTDRYTLRANIDHKLYDWISAGVNFQLTHNRHTGSPYERATVTDTQLGSPYGYYDAELDEYIIGNELVERPLDAGGYVNPLIDNESERLYSAKRNSTNVVANVYADIRPFKGMTFRTQLNTHLSNSSNGSYVDAASADQIESGTNKSTATYTKSSGTYLEWNNILTYKFTMLPEDHNLSITALTSWNRKTEDFLAASSIGQLLASNLWWNMASNDGNDGSSIHSSGYTQEQNFSYAGRIQYDYKGRYLFTASMRRDGASRLADGHKWDWFPSAAIAWRISDEKFMESTKSWLTDLKLRATYGVTGNSGIGVYGTKSGITFANWSFGFQDTAANRYILGTLDNNGSGYYVIGNTDTKWEKSKTVDLGFDMTLFKNRVNIVFDWYNTKTTDLILLRSLPTSAGQDGKYATYTNIGSTQNRGFEFTVNSRNIVSKDFDWNSTLTFSSNREKILDLVDGTNIQVGTNKEDGTLMLGHPIKSYNTFKYDGIWTTQDVENAIANGTMLYKDADKTQPFAPGDIRVADLDGDGVIDQNKDVDFVGSTSPDWFAGFNNDLRYKNWDLNIYLYARWGHWGASPTAGFDPSTGGDFTNMDYWIAGTNEGASLPALYKGRKLYDYVGYQSLSYCEQSFIKIKRISLGYTLPKSVLSKINIQNARIYCTVTNPFYSAKENWLEDRDPEGDSRSVTLGLNINF
ncbi:MAG: TonB-dependent receptor [Prevotella sp.]|nr:TonB-dependent receptor [Prevotella sp.]